MQLFEEAREDQFLQNRRETYAINQLLACENLRNRTTTWRNAST